MLSQTHADLHCKKYWFRLSNSICFDWKYRNINNFRNATFRACAMTCRKKNSNFRKIKIEILYIVFFGAFFEIIVFGNLFLLNIRQNMKWSPRPRQGFFQYCLPLYIFGYKHNNKNTKFLWIDPFFLHQFYQNFIQTQYWFVGAVNSVILDGLIMIVNQFTGLLLSSYNWIQFSRKWKNFDKHWKIFAMMYWVCAHA